ncbi:MAG: EAL domain-containing protein [Pseudomonadota bacterium]
MFKQSRKVFKRQFARLKGLVTLGSVGITPRLAIAFAGVAALAAAANLIVENGVSILEQQRSVEMERVASDARAITTLRASMGRAKQVVSSAELSMALGRFDRAVQDHVEADSHASAARYASSRVTLERELGEYSSEAGEATPKTLPEVVGRHKRSAATLIDSGRARRGLLARYSTAFARMDARVGASLDGAFRIFGRVVARQSLLKLRAQFDDLRVAFAARDSFDDGADVGSPLAKAEQALAETLRANELTLRKSQGATWYNGMNEDLAQLVATRTTLRQVESKRIATVRAFKRESESLNAILPKTLEIEAPVSQTALQPAASATAPATVTNNVVAPPPATLSTTIIPVEKPSGSIVAWVSAVVLVVLLYICFATIFSIVRPVRRLVAATARLAKGENARVVASGGIRELDTLAVAFNAMAEQLATARASTRDAQQRLEAKVEERTRQLQELAEQDPLTGLANRRHLFAALNQALDCARTSGERVGVFFLDVDNFKTLNDSLGHAYGDRVLVAIAQRIEVIARANGFAARLGGDEFTVVHQGAEEIDEILACGAAIVRAFETPVVVDDREVIVSVSVGASVFPDHEQDVESLLRAADAALFRAKALGRSQLATFTPELLTTASAKFALEQRLRRAIHKGEFELFYQPLVSLQTLDVQVVEALIRWRMPNGSYLLPGEFLAVAEESGLIMEISDWVLRNAIETAAFWHRGAWREAKVAINVSPRQFLDYRFVDTLKALLIEFQLPARCVEIELTETVLQTGPATIKTLHQLRAMGVAIALDDFGTGYSSLASLQELPLTRVKLDRSLIDSIDGGARSASIAKATIGLCRDLGLDVTAEGVERLEQLAMLLPHRALTLQGYLLARPVSRDDLLPLLRKLPEQCQELVRLAQKFSPQVPALRLAT